MIERGKAWGSPVELSGREPHAADDAALAQILKDRPGERVLLTGGDLFTSLGGQPAETPHELPIDLLEVNADGSHHVAVSHVVVRRLCWSGPFAVAMNGTHLGGWNLGPKAHPNDGLVDVTYGSLSLADRVKARRRAPAGAHVPHPALTTRRVRTWTHDFARATPLRVDNVVCGTVVHLEIRVVADAGSVVLAPPRP
ncbi:MAG: hypothetical protein GX868_14100 [Actinobacteria bacterium]|nr:hypothetical protein [Actinomycetota bacterium]